MSIRMSDGGSLAAGIHRLTTSPLEEYRHHLPRLGVPTPRRRQATDAEIGADHSSFADHAFLYQLGGGRIWDVVAIPPNQVLGEAVRPPAPMGTRR